MSEAEGKKKLTIDIVSDVVCPWCFIGKRRLESALAMAPDLDVDLRWRPFQLEFHDPAGRHQPEGICRAQIRTRARGGYS